MTKLGLSGGDDAPPDSDGRAPSAGAAGASDLARPGRGIALGVERLGLIGLRGPAASVVIAVMLAIAAIFGIGKITIDDSLSELFRSDTPDFKLFEQVSAQFPSAEYDVLVVVEGQSLLARDSIEKLRSLVTDLQLVDGARGVISLFSVREPSATGGIPAPLFPEPLPQGADYDALVQQVKSNALIRGRLLSDNGALALVVLSLEPAVVASARLQTVVRDIRQTTTDDLKGADLTSQLSGVPVMQLEIRNALERDRLVYNMIGFLAGCGIAILFFRRVSFMIVAAAPPLLAVAFTLGALGWFGFRLNMFLNAMTPLIMVISFSDSMQLTFAARDAMIAGADRRTAFRNAITIVGPACVLTHATAGLSFLGLLSSDSDLIRTFGEAGFLATVIALVTVLSLVPALGALLAPRDPAFVSALRSADLGVATLRRFCAWIAARMVRRPGLYTLIDLGVVCCLALAYAELQPRYNLADQVPNAGQAMQASASLDAQLTGENPVDVLVTFPAGAGLYDPQTLATITETHDAIEQQNGIGNVWSLETLRRWLAQQPGLSGVAVLRQYVDLLPQFLVRRFVSADQKEVIVSARVPNKDSARLLPIVNQLNDRLNAVRAQHPGYKIDVTGLAVIAARNSAGMIDKLNRALTIEFVFVAAFIGLAFRSFAVAPASLLAGIFPVLAAGAVLRLLGQGLQFASVVALMVSFGLGLSATVHFLNRMWREDRRDRDPAIAVERATVLIGPALILTTLVLACGLATLALSALPALRVFGWLSAVAMLAALAGDLLILRPTITYLMRFRGARPFRRESPPREPPDLAKRPGGHDDTA